MNAKEACWELHLENVQLRGAIENLKAENRRLHSRVDSLERSSEKLRSRLYAAKLALPRRYPRTVFRNNFDRYPPGDYKSADQ